MHTGPLSVNTYIAHENGRGFIVDPGGNPDGILRRAAEAGVRPEWILLTHGHFDHVLGAAGLVGRGLKLALYEKEASALSSRSLSLCDMIGADPPNVRPDKLLSDGEEAEFAGIRVRTLWTPGHTAGSCCYLAGNVLFSGDTLFAGSYGRTDFPTGSFAALVRSVKKLFALECDADVYPGHDESTTLSAERAHNPLAGA